jgi:hypothetical protein
MNFQQNSVFMFHSPAYHNVLSEKYRTSSLRKRLQKTQTAIQK